MDTKQNEGSSYSFDAKVISGKLELHLIYKGSKNKYMGLYDDEQLRTCGFPANLATDPHSASKFLMAAKYGVDGIQFLIQFEERGEKTAIIYVFQEVQSCRILDIKLNLVLIPRDRFEILEEQIMDFQSGNQQLNLQLKRQVDTLKGIETDNKTLTQRVNTLNQKLMKSDGIISRLTTELASVTQKLDDYKIENNGLINNFRQHAMPKGSIIIWSGAVNDIPKGWQLCNGRERAPDLRDRFIIGAGRQFDPNNAGGSDSHDHKVELVRSCYKGSVGAEYIPRGVDCGRQKHLPPYYALCFIVKII